MNKLFRKSAVEHRSQRLYGDVLLLPKLSHAIITFILVIWFFLVVSWLFLSSYAKTEMVFGWLEPRDGIVRVYPDSQGIIQEVFVQEGDYVEEGDVLLSINNDSILKSGAAFEALLLSEYISQQELLKDQLKRIDKEYDQQLLLLEKKMVSANKELKLLQDQYNAINQQHSLLVRRTKKMSELKADGYISQNTYDSSLEKELSLQSQRQEASRLIAMQESVIDQLRFNIDSIPTEKLSENNEILKKISDIEQKKINSGSESFRFIKASRDGVINNLQAGIGQQVASNRSIPLLAISPKNQEMRVYLLVPTRSIGFIEPGQPIAIRYDAFPYQKFGIHSGAIDSVSDVILLPDELLSSPVLAAEPVYKITASLDSKYIEAYEKQFHLRSGMTLNADINLGTRPLVQWLLEPLYSLQGSF